jgi:hypothetical protein
MKSPFKMTPGRGNMPKTGRGIPPTLMSKSPMYQAEEVEYTGQGRMAVKKAQDRIKNEPEKTAEYDSAMGLVRNPATNELSGKPYEKKYLPGGEGQNDRIIDGAGRVVSESKGTHPDARKKLKAEFDRLKLITESQRRDNSEGLNAFQGNTKPENLNEKQKQSMLNSTRVKVSESPAQQTKKPAAKTEEGLGTKIANFGRKLDKALTGKSSSGGGQGNTSQEKISVGDYSMDLTGPNAFKVNKKTGEKKSPARQVSKGAFKKPAMTSSTSKPKTGKAPMKMKKC